VAVDATDELIVEIESDLYDATDPGWLREIDLLAESLEREAVGVRRSAPASPRSKGVMTELVVQIAGSGAGQVAATVLLGWTAGYRDRRLKIRRRGSTEEALTVQNRQLDQNAVAKLAADLAELGRPGGATPE
jgi:hypothetical protein